MSNNSVHIPFAAPLNTGDTETQTYGSVPTTQTFVQITDYTRYALL